MCCIGGFDLIYGLSFERARVRKRDQESESESESEKERRARGPTFLEFYFGNFTII